MNLGEKILIFIGYYLPQIGYKFSYSRLQEIFQQCYGITYSINTLRKEFSNLKRSNLIELTPRYRKPYPILSREGRLKITPRLPFKKFGDWDSKWRIVLFHLPQRDQQFRKIFRHNLIEMGFQRIQKGAYISPHPFLPSVKRIAIELGIRQYLVCFETSDIDQEKRTIQKVWHLDEINTEYLNFINQTKVIQPGPFWPFKAKELEQKFYQIYQKDPHLPKELLPDNWQGEEAYRKYKEIVMSY